MKLNVNNFDVFYQFFMVTSTAKAEATDRTEQQARHNCLNSILNSLNMTLSQYSTGDRLLRTPRGQYLLLNEENLVIIVKFRQRDKDSTSVAMISHMLTTAGWTQLNIPKCSWIM